MKDIITFLNELTANNNREWFQINKPRYDKIKADVQNLTQNLINTLATIDPRASVLSPSDCLYRIYRDTRFSREKTPYKTHIGIFINPPYGKKSLTMGHYLHIEPDNVFFAAGTVCLPSPLIRNLRQAIYDNVEEYAAIVFDPEFAGLFPVIGENSVKTAPKGFPKDWEYIDLIRPRDFVAMSQKLSSTLSLDELPSYLRPYFVQADRFNSFHNYTIEEYIENNGRER